MKLVILNSHREPEELLGPQSTSGTELLKIWENLVECIGLCSVWNAFSIPTPTPQEQQWLVNGHVKHVLNFFAICAHHTLVFVITQTMTNGLKLLLLIEYNNPPVQEFVQNDPESWTNYFTTINVYYVFKLRHISIPEYRLPKGKTHSHEKDFLSLNVTSRACKNMSVTEIMSKQFGWDFMGLADAEGCEADSQIYFFIIRNGKKTRKILYLTLQGNCFESTSQHSVTKESK